MLRIVIVGGTGHVGTYLVPRLVQGGHEILSISRGESKPYRNHPAWESVEQVRVDRAAEEAAGDFGERVRSRDQDPCDVLVRSVATLRAPLMCSLFLPQVADQADHCLVGDGLPLR